MNMKFKLLLAGLVSGFVSINAVAAGTSTNGEWEQSLAPLFLWGVSIDGSASIGGNEAPMTLDFKDDILENMEGVLTFRYEARNDRMGLFVEYQYLNIAPEVVIGPARADIDFKSTMFEAGMAYALNESDTTRWELLGGVRYTEHEIDVDITLEIQPLPPGFPQQPGGQISGGEEWLHPFLGGRVDHTINDKWSFIGRTDYGFGDEDDTALNVSAIFSYRFRDWGSVLMGYRYLEYDFDNGKAGVGNYGYDANQQGPLLGLNLTW